MSDPLREERIMQEQDRVQQEERILRERTLQEREQEPPRDPLLPYEEPVIEEETEVEDQTLRASGMLSTVLTEGIEEEEEATSLGHILMLDYDDCDDVTGRISMLDSEPGISVLLESSSGSYHGYNLSVRGIEQQIYRAAQTESEHGHVRSSARRDHFVLRWSRKVRETTEETYKEAPEVIWCSVTEAEEPQSAPHLTALAQRAEEDGQQEIADRLRSYEGETVGDGLSVDHYQTLTDEIKETRS